IPHHPDGTNRSRLPAIQGLIKSDAVLGGNHLQTLLESQIGEGIGKAPRASGTHIVAWSSAARPESSASCFCARSLLHVRTDANGTGPTEVGGANKVSCVGIYRPARQVDSMLVS